MNANELMIGDWVLLTDGPARVISIAQDGIYFEDKFGRGVCSFDKIQPISLTAEILEKNGFETEDAKDGGFVICDDYYDIFIYEWSDSIWVARYESTEMYIPFEQATMSYVHELQHFLRTSGIEKEIEL